MDAIARDDVSLARARAELDQWRAGTRLKMIVNDGVGGWLITRRFSRGKLAFWPAADDTMLHPLVAHELAVMPYNGDPTKAELASHWRSVS
jgi:transposase